MDMLSQHVKTFYIKIQLLNKSMAVVDEIGGTTIDGSITIDANSDIRRTYDSTILLKDKSFLVGQYSKIWLDKYVRVYWGVRHLRSNEIVYYPLGVFLFNQNNFTYDAVTQSLSISCVDLMSQLTGERNGQVAGMTTQILVDSDIRNAMVSAVTELGGFSNYIIDDIGKKVPYDLKFSTGVTVYEIVSKLRDLFPAWETFFNVDGTFICQAIPSCIDDNIVLDSATMNKLVISENISAVFSQVKNKTEVWGKSISADRFAETSTISGNQYGITLDTFELKSGAKIAFKAIADNPTNPTLKINALTAYGIYSEDDQSIPAGRLKANTTYVVRFRSNKFYLMGQFQIYGVAEDNNPSSPYYVGAKHENVILQVLSGGDFDKIYSDELCQQRAEYENWKSTRLTDSLNIQMKFVPWLDVNQKVEYTSHVTGETCQYIIKKISCDLVSGIMSVEMIKFYPLYPNIIG